MNRFGAFLFLDTRRCSKNTNGPALPSMIGTSPATDFHERIVDSHRGAPTGRLLDRRNLHIPEHAAWCHHGVADVGRESLDVHRIRKVRASNTNAGIRSGRAAGSSGSFCRCADPLPWPEWNSSGFF